VFAVVDDAHVRHPYSTVVAEVIAHLVFVLMIFSCYRANGELATNVANSVSIVVEAKIKEATGANIADVVLVIIYVSVILGIHGNSAIIAMSVIVGVRTLKRFIASVAHVVAVIAFVHTTPYDVVLNLMFGHFLIETIKAYEFVAFQNLDFGRRNGLTVLEFYSDVVYAVNFVAHFVHYYKAYGISDSLVVDLQHRATVRIDVKLLGVESFKDIHHTVIVNNEMPVIVYDRTGSAFSVRGVYQVVAVSVGLLNVMLDREGSILVRHKECGIYEIVCRHFLRHLIYVELFFVKPTAEGISLCAEYRGFG
jgi:hypothetical protein